MANVADGQDLFGAGRKKRANGFENRRVASDIINELTALGGITTAGEGRIKKSGLAVAHDLGCGECIAR